LLGRSVSLALCREELSGFITHALSQCRVIQVTETISPIQHYFLPRLSDSFAARNGLQNRQLALSKSLAQQLETLKHHLSSANSDGGDAKYGPVEDDGPILDHSSIPMKSSKIDFEVCLFSFARLPFMPITVSRHFLWR
jgi:hypothetical protein